MKFSALRCLGGAAILAAASGPGLADTGAVNIDSLRQTSLIQPFLDEVAFDQRPNS